MVKLKNLILLVCAIFLLSGCAGLADWFKVKEDAPPVIKKVVIPHDPKKAKEHYDMGTKFVKQGEAKKAATHFKKATQFDKKNIKYHYDLAVALTSLSSTSKQAEREFKKVIIISKRKNGSKHKEVFYSHYGLASIYALRNQKSLAVKSLIKSVEAGFTHYNMLKNDSDFYGLKGFKKFDDFVKALD